ncbi:MAG TPA: pentapeptide repeat-containing protein, partial [Nitrososphaera sp.]|nr:pentapeptide repeat-containing protein [Nitrososphaera sp.]
HSHKFFDREAHPQVMAAFESGLHQAAEAVARAEGSMTVSNTNQDGGAKLIDDYRATFVSEMMAPENQYVSPDKNYARYKACFDELYAEMFVLHTEEQRIMRTLAPGEPMPTYEQLLQRCTASIDPMRASIMRPFGDLYKELSRNVFDRYGGPDAAAFDSQGKLPKENLSTAKPEKLSWRSREEEREVFLQRVREEILFNPLDPCGHLMYADWLEEFYDDGETANRIRNMQPLDFYAYLLEQDGPCETADRLRRTAPLLSQQAKSFRELSLKDFRKRAPMDPDLSREWLEDIYNGRKECALAWLADAHIDYRSAMRHTYGENDRVSRAELRRIGLIGADLNHIDLRGACLDNLYIEDCQMIGAQLQGVRARGCYIVGGGRLNGARFYCADLRHAEIDCRLTRVRFRDADLRGAHLPAVCHECDFTGADLRGAVLPDSLRSCTVSGANVEGTDLSKVQMTEAQYASLRKDSKTIPPSCLVE